MHTDTRTIPLTQGFEAIVDATYYDALAAHKWYAQKYLGGFRAVRTVLDGASGVRRAVYMHRIITNAPSGMVVDHINHNGLDNRIENLRVCSQGQNGCNRRGSDKDSNSRYLGVSWDKSRGKWRASIKTDGRVKYLGRFSDERLAAIAYDAAARLYHGNFANPNSKQGS